MDDKLQEILAALEPWKKHHSRKAYKPIVEPTNDMVHHSRFGGSPLLTPDTEWPKCGSCGQPMHMLLQLDLAKVPINDLPWESGLLQFFYCTDWESEFMCDDYEAFSPCHVIRIIQNTEKLSTLQVPHFQQQFPAKQITRWNEFPDYPGYQELETNGLKSDFDYNSRTGKIEAFLEEKKIADFDIPDNYFLEEVLEEISAKQKDKLGGWPYWLQNIEYPDCPKCKQKMEYFFQIDSEDNVPHMFGDVGLGHITFCRQHPEILAFQWACH